MSRKNKKRSTQRVRRPASGRPASVTHSSDPLTTVLTVAVAALLVARMLVPTESAAQGETLWLVQLWLAAAMVWAWKCFRNADHRIRFDWCDMALWLLIAGQVVSALVVVATEGHKRAAINMLWEWIGLGVMFFVVRQVVRTQAIRQRLLGIMISATVVLALFGLWQHYVWYSQTIENYDTLRQTFDDIYSRLTGVGSVSHAERQRLAEMRLEFVQQGIPMYGQARELWEKRLRSSREPFGMFALANTFAGVLLVWLIVLASSLLRRDARRWHWLFAIPALAIVAYCLLLTKSRTAWVGLLFGLGTLAFSQRHRLPAQLGRLIVSRRPIGVTAIAAITIVFGLIAVAAYTGGLDRNVLAEAPKSLQYRLHYWTGTWNLIREYPVFGTGPGNFRQHYLKHKLPESSEDIADPHNFALDVWANAGSVGFIGLLSMLFVATKTFRQSAQPKRDTVGTELTPQAVRETRPLILGAYLGFLLVAAVAYLFGHPIDNRLLALLAGFAIVHRLGSMVWNDASFPNAALGAAAVGLLVHLCGAGGIAMPAVGQTFLVLLALATVPCQSADNVAVELGAARRTYSAKVIAAIEIGASLFFVGCLMTATVPIWQRQTRMSTANYFLYEVRSREKAMSMYRAAAAADIHSPDPWDQLSQLSYGIASSVKVKEAYPTLFDRAMRNAREAIARDPAHWSRYHQIGRWKLEGRYYTSADAYAAVKYLRDAARRHPTNPHVHADLATAFSNTGDRVSARFHAERARKLDEINRKAGHTDKYLPQHTIERLRGLSSSW